MFSVGGSMTFLPLGDGFAAEYGDTLFPRFTSADGGDDDDADESFVFSCASDMRETGVVATA